MLSIRSSTNAESSARTRVVCCPVNLCLCKYARITRSTAFVWASPRRTIRAFSSNINAWRCRHTNKDAPTNERVRFETDSGRSEWAEDQVFERSMTIRFLFIFDLRLVVQHRIQQQTMDFNRSVIADETELTELVHKMTYARSGGADHLRQRFLADLGVRVIRVVLSTDLPLPVNPEQRTSSDRPVWSVSCH